jgi:hypothetical protein
MGSVSWRLAQLEELSRERARSFLRQAWGSLADEEAAFLLASYAEWVPDEEPTSEEQEVRKKTRAAMPEELIAQAIGLTDLIKPEEIDRRIGKLVQTLGTFECGDGIRRHT